MTKVKFCHQCERVGREIEAVATIGKVHLCAVHLTDDALRRYAQIHLNMKKPQEQQDFANRVFIKLQSEVIYNIDEQAKDEFGIL